MYSRRKHLVLLFVLSLAFLIVSSAFGDAMDDYNRSCPWKIVGTVNIYSDWACTQPIGTITGPKYVKMSGWGQETCEILWRNPDGSVTYAGIHTKDVVSAKVYFREDNGSLDGMNELVFKDLYGYIPSGTTDRKTMNEHAQMRAESNEPNQDSSQVSYSDNAGNYSETATKPANTKKAGKITTRQNNTPKKNTVSRYSIMQGENKENEVRVEVLALGSASSRIKVSGATTEVATDELLLDRVTVGDRLAWIYAPRQGYCSLRSKASDNGKVLKKCRAGYLVVVLEKGQEYTKIDYQGTDGYVLNGCLKYIDETQQPTGTGTIIYSKKKPNVRTTINIRNNMDGKSKKVAEWKTGTEVPVYSHPDGWYEVEYDGIRGYIMEKYLQINE